MVVVVVVVEMMGRRRGGCGFDSCGYMCGGDDDDDSDSPGTQDQATKESRYIPQC